MDELNVSFLERIMALRTAMRRQYVTNHGKSFGMAMHRIRKLSLEGPVTVSRIASDAGFSVAAATQMTNMLVKKGFLRRLKSPNDARVYHLELTSEGIEAADMVQCKASDVANRLLQFLGEDDAAELNRLIGRVLMFIEEGSSTQGGLL
jgi:DNA-binding MarR family transcriptional regulator